LIRAVVFLIVEMLAVSVRGKVQKEKINYETLQQRDPLQ